jgi:beta-glucosidase
MKPHQPAQKRARELLAVMTQADKISLVTGGQVDPSLGIPQLGADDGPNGLRSLGAFPSGAVTAFPAAETLAASFDTSLASAYGTALGQEAWGKGLGQVLGPNLNIARTPYGGRQSETFGEDPFLSGQIAASEVAAMQGQHIIATPKHFATNNQETDRFGLPSGSTAMSTNVSERALQEIYDPPFKAAVTEGGAESVMCATNRINGEYSCQDSSLLNTLKQDWGFQGFVIPDTFADRDQVTAFNAGLDTGISAATLTAALADGSISRARLDDAVVRILTAKFATGQFDVANTGSPTASVATPAHQNLAAQESEEGSVLLQNRDNTLPLSAATKSIAVIGEPGTNPTQAQLESGGSAYVCPNPTAPVGLCLSDAGVVTPLAGITARAGAGVTINSTEGSLGDVPLTTPIPASVLTPSSGTGPGLTGTYFPADNFTGTSATRVDTDFNIPNAACPAILNNTCVLGPASPPLIPTGAPTWSVKWTGTLTPPETGNYRFAAVQSVQVTLTIDGQTILTGESENDPGFGLGAPDPEQGLVHLVAGQPVTIEFDFQANQGGGNLQLGWETPSQIDPMISQAAAAAAKSQVAIVFVNQNTSEGMDRSNLDLPGDQNLLISAVAAANPNTVVVLNTGGAVLMPWLDQVKSVIEAWLPGQEDGQAIAALLFGDANFSGRLPITWPASPQQGPGQTPAQFPGVDNNAAHSEGIFVGYRYYQQHDQQPQFPFGYGLSYTNFSIKGVAAKRVGGDRVNVTAQVTNTGTTAGTDVVEAYVRDPARTGEPPQQLKAFGRITLQPGQSGTVRFGLDSSAFSYFKNGTWVIAPGTYTISVGTSANTLIGSAQVVLRNS